MKRYFSFFVALCIGCTLLGSCEQNHQQRQKETTKPSITLKQIPTFNADSAYAYIKKQVDFGPRTPGAAAHDACGRWLYEKLQGFGLQTQMQVFEAQSFDGKTYVGRNIIASYRPDIKRRILLMAHWDTRAFADKEAADSLWRKPIDGANDGGSGVAVLLEIARLLTAEQPAVGVDIILFDMEDNGVPEFMDEAVGNASSFWCQGSQYWAKNPHTPNYSAYYGILLDMVGAQNARFYKEPYSLEYAPQIVEKVWHIAQLMGYGNYFINQKANISFGGILDDHFYVNRDAKIPSIDIIDYQDGFRDYHHTLKDNLSIIDKNTLKAVGEVVLQVLYQEIQEEKNAQ